MSKRVYSRLSQGVIQPRRNVYKNSVFLNDPAQSETQVYIAPESAITSLTNLKLEGSELSFDDQLEINKQDIATAQSKIASLNTRLDNLPGAGQALSVIKAVQQLVRSTTSPAGYTDWNTGSDTSAYLTGLPELQFSNNMATFTPTSDMVVMFNIGLQGNGGLNQLFHINQGGNIITSFGWNNRWTQDYI